MTPSAIQQIKELIQADEPITEKTRDVLMLNAIVDIYEQLQEVKTQMQPLIQFYKGVLWVGVTVIGALITMALSGKIEIQIK